MQDDSYDVVVTITAVRRSEILAQTLDSFYSKMLFGLKTLIAINVDPIGADEDPEMCVALCRQYADTVVSRTPEKQNFGYAWYWTWGVAMTAPSPWILNLEDDWLLLRPVNIEEIFSILKKFPKLALLRFSLWPSGQNKIMAWDKVPFDWNGVYFHCPEKSMNWSYCGHPSIIKREWFKEMFPMCNPGLNPEKQFRKGNDKLKAAMVKWDYGLYQKPNEEEYIRDIGRSWRKAAGFLKKKDTFGSGPEYWVKKDGSQI